MNLHPKVAASGLAGAVSTLVVILASVFGVSIPPDVVAAALTIVTFAAGYLRTPTPPAA